MKYRYTNCIAGFNLPIVLKNQQTMVKHPATDELQTLTLTAEQLSLVTVDGVKKMYYVDPVQLK